MGVSVAPEGVRGGEHGADAEMYASVVRQLAQGLVVWHLEDDLETLTLVTSNPAAMRMTGVETQGREGASMRALFPNILPERERLYRQVATSGKSHEIGDVRYVDREGVERFIFVRLLAVPTRSVAVLFEDVTEQRRAREEMRRNEERFRALIENSADGIIIADEYDAITYASPAALQILGMTELGPEAANSWSLVHPEDIETIRANYEARRAQPGVPHPFELRIRRTSGGWRYVEAVAINHLDNPNVRGTVANFRDVTHRKEVELELLKREQQLRQAQKMEAIGLLAGGVAHDFNNLLSVILSYSALMLEQLADDNGMRADIREIQLSGERAADLTRQLLAFSRQQVLEPRVVDLNDVLTAIGRMLRRIVGEDIEVSMFAAPDLGRVRVDPSQVEQVIMNLVINARDAMPTGGRLTIETSNVVLDEAYAQEHMGVTPGEHVMLAVTDTGSGIDKVARERIFEPFFTTKEKGKGTGLGLATVFGIVKQSGGSIWLYSEPGRGTTFKIYFPRTFGESEPLKIGGPPARAIGSETILLVEDEAQLRAVATSILVGRGFNVIAAAGPDEALRIVQDPNVVIDLLVTDVVMPRMSGRELADKVRVLRPEMKVLYVSGYTENTIVHHGVLDPGIAFLQKPITPSSLAEKVRAVLDAD